MRKGSIRLELGGQEWWIGIREARAIVATLKAQLQGEENWAYDPDIAKDILQQLSEGRPLEDVCQPPYPPPEVFLRWCKDDQDLQAAYQEALVRQADSLFHRIYTFAQEIADRIVNKKDPLSQNEVSTYRVLLDTLRWMCAKLNPAKFADYQRVGMETQIGWRIIYKGICSECGKDLLPDPTLKAIPVKKEGQERKRDYRDLLPKGKKFLVEGGQKDIIKKLGGLDD